MHVLNAVFRGAPTVAEQPFVTLTRWRLVECVGPEGGRLRRLVGRTVPRPGGVRITSPLVTWDAATLRAVTESGRSYELARPEPDDEDDDFATQAAVVAALHGCEDVTDRVVARGGAWDVHDA